MIERLTRVLRGAMLPRRCDSRLHQGSRGFGQRMRDPGQPARKQRERDMRGKIFVLTASDFVEDVSPTLPLEAVDTMNEYRENHEFRPVLRMAWIEGTALQLELKEVR